jgi:hypothetical protein
MSRCSTRVSPVASAVICALGFIAPRHASAAEWQKTVLDPAVRSWMAVLTLAATDGEQSERSPGPGDREGRGRRDREPGAPPRGVSMEGPRMDALGKLDQILARLSRIESMLAERAWNPRDPGPGPRGPQAGRPGWSDFQRPGGGAPRSPGREAAERGPGEGRPRPDAEQMRAAMAERFTEARKRFAMMDDRIKALETEVEQLKKQLEHRDAD